MKIVQKVVILLLIIVITFFGYKTLTKPKRVIEANEVTQIVLVTDENIIQMHYPEEDIKQLGEGGWIPQTLLDFYFIYSDYDAEEDIITISDGFDTISYDLTYETATLNGETFNMTKPEVKDGLLWLPLKDLADLFNLEYDTNNDRKTLFVKKNTVSYELGETTKETDLLFSHDGDRILSELNADESLIVFPYDDVFDFVMTKDYQVGYIEKDVLSDTRTYVEGAPPKEDPIKRDEKVYLTWEIYGRGYDTDKIGEMRGVNVISPAWYALSDSKGNFESKPSENYTKWAKTRGYEVWALVSNDFKVDRTSEFLHSAQARKYFIDNLLNEYIRMGFDGVNIDFENVYKEDKRQLTQFVAELTTAFRANDIVVSMDVTVIGGSDTWSKCYDRKALGHLVDYLAIMTYDEHWASSPISGSVSSYNWMKSSMEKIKDLVPSEKLLLGIPYYMRVWSETPSTDKVNVMNVKSGVLNMPNAEKWIKEKNLNLIWDDNAKQHYAGFFENGVLKKIWFENADSVKAKASLVNELDLGGVAIWRRGFETQDVWGVVDDAIKSE